MKNPKSFTSIAWCALILLLLIQTSCTRSRLASVSPALHADQALSAPQPQQVYQMSDASSVVSSDTLVYTSDTDFVSMEGREHVSDARPSGMSSVLLHPSKLLKKAIDLKMAHVAMKGMAQMPGRNKSRIGTTFFFGGGVIAVLGMVFFFGGAEALGLIVFLVGLVAAFVGLLFLFWWLISEWNSPTMPNTIGKIGLLLFLLPLLIAFGLFFLTVIPYFGDVLAIVATDLFELLGIGVMFSLIGLLVLLIGLVIEGGAERTGQGQK